MAKKIIVGDYEILITPQRVKICTINGYAIKWYITLCKFYKPVKVVYDIYFII